MPNERSDQERPCLHCMMVELIDDFFAEHALRPAYQTQSIPTKATK